MPFQCSQQAILPAFSPLDSFRFERQAGKQWIPFLKSFNDWTRKFESTTTDRKANALTQGYSTSVNEGPVGEV